MKVLMLTKYYPEGSSSRYRFYNYIEYFEKAGHTVNVKPLFNDGYVKALYSNKKTSKISIAICIVRRFLFILFNKKKFDVLMLEKELFTYIPYPIEKLLLGKSLYTLDFDDAISVSYRSNPLTKLFLSNKINKLSAKAAATFVGNKWYWKEIKNGNLNYLPTNIDLIKYPLNRNNKKNEVPIIVWIGSPATSHYLFTLENVLIEVAKRENFILRVIGGNDIKISGVNIENVKWTSENEFELLSSSDIGIMPLDSLEWKNGKCGLKIIQYMAAELPVIASPTMANEEILRHEESGFIAKNDLEWIEFLTILIQNNDKRIQFGKKGRDLIETSFNYQVWGPRLVDMTENIFLHKK